MVEVAGTGTQKALHESENLGHVGVTCADRVENVGCQNYGPWKTVTKSTRIGAKQCNSLAQGTLNYSKYAALNDLTLQENIEAGDVLEVGHNRANKASNMGRGHMIKTSVSKCKRDRNVGKGEKK